MKLSRLAHLPLTLSSSAAWAVTHPLRAGGRVAGFAKGVASGSAGLAEAFAARIPEQRGRSQQPAPSPTETDRAGQAGRAGQAEEPDQVERRDDHVAREAAPGPTVVAPAPAPPAQPPVDVVEQALAAEARGDQDLAVGGMQGEPHPVTREEIHEGAPMTRAERDEIEEETEEALHPDER